MCLELESLLSISDSVLPPSVKLEYMKKIYGPTASFKLSFSFPYSSKDVQQYPDPTD